jgi:hypothetical protein
MLVVAISDKWSAKDYGIKEDEMIHAGDNNLREFLKKHGGAHGVVCGCPCALSNSPVS